MEDKKREFNQILVLELNHMLGFPLESGKAVENTDAFIEEITQKIAEYLSSMIPNQTQRLFKILYRIDISEWDTEQAFNQGSPQRVGLFLARKIIQRQLKKLETQANYSKNQNDPE